MARAAANGLGTITNLEKMAAFLKVSYGARFMVNRQSQTENGRKKTLRQFPRPLVGTYVFVHWVLKLVQLVKTAPKHNRCIEVLGDDILRWTYLDFIYVHPIVLWFTCKAQ